MIIVGIEPCNSEIIEIAEIPPGCWTTFRRHSWDHWEVMMGESWETEFHCEEIEKAYQKYKNA